MYVNLILHIGWMKSVYTFCVKSETFVGVANGCVLTPTSFFVVYPSTVTLYSINPRNIACPCWLQYKDVYIDDFICSTLQDVHQPQRMNELVLCTTKEIFHSFPEEAKDSFIPKKERQRGDWSKKMISCDGS